MEDPLMEERVMKKLMDLYTETVDKKLETLTKYVKESLLDVETGIQDNNFAPNYNSERRVRSDGRHTQEEQLYELVIKYICKYGHPEPEEITKIRDD